MFLVGWLKGDRRIAGYSGVMARLLERPHASAGSSKYPPAEPEALRLLAPRRGLFATVESKSKNNSKNAESKTREYSWNCQTSTASPAVGLQTYGLDNKVRNRGRAAH